MSALIIGEDERVALNNLRQYAESHKIEVDELLDIFNGQVSPVGDRNEFCCNIPVGYRVVFCIEYQKKGYARHMSVSFGPMKPNRCPHPAAIKELMGYFGFQGKLNGKEVMVYLENENTAVNVIEYIK